MSITWQITIVFNLINTVIIQKVRSQSPVKYGHSQRGSNISVTGHTTGSDD